MQLKKRQARGLPYVFQRAVSSTFAIFGVRGFITAFISSGLIDFMNDTLPAGAFINSCLCEKGKRQPIAALQINGKSRAKGRCIDYVREWPTKCRVGPAALRRAGPPVSQPTCTEWWAGARTELVPPDHATDRSLSDVYPARPRLTHLSLRHTNPKCKRGGVLRSLLTLRVSVSLDRARYK